MVMSAPTDFSGLVEQTEGLPDWWGRGGNRLYMPAGSILPTLEFHPGLEPPFGAMVALRSPNSGLGRVILWGDEPKVYIGDRCTLPGMIIACEGGATIHLDGRMSVNGGCSLDARNGGSITIGEYGLWGEGVRAVTDDMHTIRDMDTGLRVNRRGSDICIDRHVWVGMQTLVFPGAAIGESSVVGARSIVSSTLPAHSLSVGTPARVVREGITWTFDDLP